MLTTGPSASPWIAVLENSPGGTVAQVRRWSGSSWDAVGPGIGGLNPEELPRLGIDSSDRPVVSYRMTDPGTGFIRVQVVRLDNEAWVPMGSALQGRSDPPLNLELGVFLREAMTMRDGDRPAVAFTTGNAGPSGIAVCEWFGTDWSCFANEAQDFGVYGPPAVTVWNGDSVLGILTFFLVDGGFVNGTGVIVPNR